MLLESIFYFVKEVERQVIRFSLLGEEYNPTQKAGGVLVIYTKEGKWLANICIGDVPPESTAKYTSVAMTKIYILLKNPDYLSSYQGRDPDNGLWGGGIRTEEHFISFSGLNEAGDEAVILVAAQAQEKIRDTDVAKIVLLSNNNTYLKLIGAA